MVVEPSATSTFYCTNFTGSNIFVLTNSGAKSLRQFGLLKMARMAKEQRRQDPARRTSTKVVLSLNPKEGYGTSSSSLWISTRCIPVSSKSTISTSRLWKEWNIKYVAAGSADASYSLSVAGWRREDSGTPRLCCSTRCPSSTYCHPCQSTATSEILDEGSLDPPCKVAPGKKYLCFQGFPSISDERGISMISSSKH